MDSERFIPYCTYGIGSGPARGEAHHHEVMVRRQPFVRYSQYVGKGWKALFRCPACGRETWQHLNFLGRRSLVCTGTKIVKQEVA